MNLVVVILKYPLQKRPEKWKSANNDTRALCEFTQQNYNKMTFLATYYGALLRNR